MLSTTIPMTTDDEGTVASSAKALAHKLGLKEL